MNSKYTFDQWASLAWNIYQRQVVIQAMRKAKLRMGCSMPSPQLAYWFQEDLLASASSSSQSSSFLPLYLPSSTFALAAKSPQLIQSFDQFLKTSNKKLPPALKGMHKSLNIEWQRSKRTRNKIQQCLSHYIHSAQHKPSPLLNQRGKAITMTAFENAKQALETACDATRWWQWGQRRLLKRQCKQRLNIADWDKACTTYYQHCAFNIAQQTDSLFNPRKPTMEHLMYSTYHPDPNFFPSIIKTWIHHFQEVYGRKIDILTPLKSIFQEIAHYHDQITYMVSANPEACSPTLLNTISKTLHGLLESAAQDVNSTIASLKKRDSNQAAIAELSNIVQAMQSQDLFNKIFRPLQTVIQHHLPVSVTTQSASTSLQLTMPLRDDVGQYEKMLADCDYMRRTPLPADYSEDIKMIGIPFFTTLEELSAFLIKTENDLYQTITVVAPLETPLSVENLWSMRRTLQSFYYQADTAIENYLATYYPSATDREKIEPQIASRQAIFHQALEKCMSFQINLHYRNAAWAKHQYQGNSDLSVQEGIIKKLWGEIHELHERFAKQNQWFSEMRASQESQKVLLRETAEANTRTLATLATVNATLQNVIDGYAETHAAWDEVHQGYAAMNAEMRAMEKEIDALQEEEARHEALQARKRALAAQLRKLDRASDEYARVKAEALSLVGPRRRKKPRGSPIDIQDESTMGNTRATTQNILFATPTKAVSLTNTSVSAKLSSSTSSTPAILSMLE